MGKGEQLPKKSSGILREGNRLVAYRFLDEYKQEFGLRWLLKKLHIHPNAYYNYLRNAKAGHHAQKSHCCQRIQALYHNSHGVIRHRQMRGFL